MSLLPALTWHSIVMKSWGQQFGTSPISLKTPFTEYLRFWEIGILVLFLAWLIRLFYVRRKHDPKLCFSKFAAVCLCIQAPTKFTTEESLLDEQQSHQPAGLLNKFAWAYQELDLSYFFFFLSFSYYPVRYQFQNLPEAKFVKQRKDTQQKNR